jgi:hypothetical protein
VLSWRAVVFFIVLIVIVVGEDVNDAVVFVDVDFGGGEVGLEGTDVGNEGGRTEESEESGFCWCFAFWRGRGTGGVL